MHVELLKYKINTASKMHAMKHVIKYASALSAKSS